MGPLKKLGHVEGGREIGTLVQGRGRGNRLIGYRLWGRSRGKTRFKGKREEA